MTEKEIISCENCDKVHERIYSNGGKLCFGIVKNPFRQCDVVRTCQTYDTGKSFVQDVALDEAMEAIAGLSATVNAYIGACFERPCEGCQEKEHGCGAT